MCIERVATSGYVYKGKIMEICRGIRDELAGLDELCNGQPMHFIMHQVNNPEKSHANHGMSSVMNHRGI